MSWYEDESIVKQRKVWSPKVNGQRQCYFVSTVRNICNTGTDSDPLWFETMIFECYEDGRCDMSGIYKREVATLAQAKADHSRVCAAIRRGEVPRCEQSPVVDYTEIGMLTARMIEDGVYPSFWRASAGVFAAMGAPFDTPSIRSLDNDPRCAPDFLRRLL